MHAFGLEESGSYERAGDVGRIAVERNPDDVWGVHAVVHALEMQGKVDEGIRFLRSREGDWGSGNLFTVHNWWHLALFLLEAGRRDDVLAIYDAQVHNDASARVPLELLDASALLWRLMLDGVDTEGRFAPLADAWTTKTVNESWYVFNDLHAVSRCAEPVVSMMRARSSRTSRARCRVLRAVPSNVMMTAEVGLPASPAAIAFTEGRYADVVAQLLPIRTRFNTFGGSHASATSCSGRSPMPQSVPVRSNSPARWSASD